MNDQQFWRRKTCCVSVLCLCVIALFPLLAAGEETSLVQNGQPNATIVIPDNASAAVRAAADSLRKTLKESFGGGILPAPHHALGLHDLLVKLQPVLWIGTLLLLFVLYAYASLTGYVAKRLQPYERTFVHLGWRASTALVALDAAPQVAESFAQLERPCGLLSVKVVGLKGVLIEVVQLRSRDVNELEGAGAECPERCPSVMEQRVE